MIVLENCHVVDVKEGKIRQGPVTVENNTIAAVGDSVGDAESVIDLKGKYLFPGLITCHFHPGIVFPFKDTDPGENPAITVLRCYRRAVDALYSGITTVRCPGELNRADLYLRKMIEDGWVEGPRMICAGQGISVTGGHGSEVSTNLADSPDEFRKKAREELAAGADFLKVFISGGIGGKNEAFDEPQMTNEELSAAVSVAKSKGTYVAAHSSAPADIIRASEIGVHSFEHAYLIDSEAARVVKKNNGYICPTLCVSRSPAWMKANHFEEWTIDKAVEVGPLHMESIKSAVREDVTLVNGTDIPPGDKDDGVNITVKEMEYYVEAGLDYLGALQTVTINPAKLMGIDDQVGLVEEGYEADLIAVKENPLTNIRALREISFIMQSGRVIRSDK